MTDRKIDNSLYVQLTSVINQALPLEYAIRAAHQESPREMAQLSEIDERIRQYWIDLGASDEEIADESLLDFAWDVIQVGFPLSRRHGRVYPDREFLDLIHRGLADIREKFGAEVAVLGIPATGYFRVCDLLHGNDILGLLQAVTCGLKDARKYEAEDMIELKKFILGIREPVHIHPGRDYVVSERRDGERIVERFGIVLDTEMEFSMPDLKRQIREFLYQFALRRESVRRSNKVDRTSGELINEFLEDELFGKIDNHKIGRLDGFVSALSGLYCWDLVKQYRLEGRKSAVETAVKNTLEIYPKNVRAVGEDAIRKNYNTARVAINRAARKMICVD